MEKDFVIFRMACSTIAQSAAALQQQFGFGSWLNVASHVVPLGGGDPGCGADAVVVIPSAVMQTRKEQYKSTEVCMENMYILCTYSTQCILPVYAT